MSRPASSGASSASRAGRRRPSGRWPPTAGEKEGKTVTLEIRDGTAVNWDEMAVVGRIARPHGIRGQVIVNPETDFPEDRFQPRRNGCSSIAAVASNR